MCKFVLIYAGVKEQCIKMYRSIYPKPTKNCIHCGTPTDIFQEGVPVYCSMGCILSDPKNELFDIV